MASFKGRGIYKAYEGESGIDVEMDLVWDSHGHWDLKLWPALLIDMLDVTTDLTHQSQGDGITPEVMP